MTSPTTRIRRCAAGDDRALALVGAATFVETYAGLLPGPDIIAHCADRHAANVYTAWLADGATRIWIAETEFGAAPVGYLVLGVPDFALPDSQDGDLEIKRVYLLHRFQHAGVGKQLMQAAITAARAAGASRVLLGAYEGNAEALSFYARLGFQPVGTRRFRMGSQQYVDPVLALPLATDIAPPTAGAG